MKTAISALNTISYLTHLPEEGKKTWDHVKDSQEHYDYIILGGTYSPDARRVP